MFFHTQLCPRLEEALVTGTGKSNNVHGKLTIKLTGIVKCTDTMCTVYSWQHATICYVANREYSSLYRDKLPQKVIHVTTASARLLLSGSGIFQVWHMQKVV